jgi:hypothetical protein
MGSHVFDTSIAGAGAPPDMPILPSSRLTARLLVVVEPSRALHEWRERRRERRAS